jgi:glycosyltransferase involved in cell wall biosynthesis
MPIEWEEPFGIVMAEAFACGTPVVGFRRGSVPEVILDGVNGFAVDDVDEALQALPKLASLDRTAIRKDCERRFSRQSIVDQYERLYRDLLARNGIEINGARADEITSAIEVHQS